MTYSGIMLDSFAYDEWVAAVKVRPDVIALFEPWGAQRFHAKHFGEVRRQGVHRHMVTWEPWSVTEGDTTDYSCDAIASGAHDAYIEEWGRRLQEYDLDRVYLRLMHESGLTARWYPWAENPGAYVAAWRRVREVLHRVDADNVRMVWSPNANLYEGFETFLRGVIPYWPGRDQVDYVGVTTINFGGVKDRPPEQFAQRALGLSWRTDRRFLLPEINTAREGRVDWLQRMTRWTLDNSSRLEAVVLSQPAASGGQATIQGVGDVQWRIEDDAWPGARPVVQRWYRALAAAR